MTTFDSNLQLNRSKAPCGYGINAMLRCSASFVKSLTQSAGEVLVRAFKEFEGFYSSIAVQRCAKVQPSCWTAARCDGNVQ